MRRDSMTLDDLKPLRDSYQKIEIPKDLDLAIRKGIEKGKKEKMKIENRPMVMAAKSAAAILIALTIFTASLNLSPAFANTMSEIPIIGKLVKVLIFTDGRAEGGKITDGTDVNELTLEQDENREVVSIHFETNDAEQTEANHYELQLSHQPSVLTVTLSGVRMISAAEDFDEIRSANYVRDIYTLITLDDSMIRLNIELEPGVQVTAKEYGDPASLELILTRPVESADEATIYSVRTASYEKGEPFAQMEETLFHLGIPYRILRDSKGAFLYEFETFDTAEAARQYLDENSAQIGIPLMVETRSGNDVPNGMSEDMPEPSETIEGTVEDKSPVEVVSSSEYPVSLKLNGNYTNATLKITEAGIEAWDMMDMDKWLVTIPYEGASFKKIKGEASFILKVEFDSTEIEISGVYQDFFDAIKPYASVEE